MAEGRFEISAAVVRQLGEELVSDEITALIELVKNSYDADATYVNVTVDSGTGPEEDSEQRGQITIEDNGFGMDRGEIERGWLTISLSSKRALKHKGLTTPRGRVPLGDKGLGRLSTQRLGENLELLTRKEGNASVHQVSFRWSDFTEAQLLSEVEVELVELPPERREVGTTLTISGLREPEEWVGRRRDELVSRLTQLVFPFGSARDFRVLMSIDGQTIDLEGLAESVRSAAAGRFWIRYEDGELLVQGRVQLSRLRGKSDDVVYHRLLEADGGRDFFRYLVSEENRHSLSDAEFIGKNGWFLEFKEKRRLETLDRVSYVQEETDGESERKPADPGNFEAEIDEFQLRGTDLNDVPVFDRTREFANYIKDQAGIRVFRDGFGIRPYGFDGNDWLNLGAGQTAGLSYYGLRPNNVVGYVQLSGEDNQKLREKTDREGLIASPFSHNFFSLMEEALRIINRTYMQVRRSYVEYRSVRISEDQGFESLSSPLSEMRNTAEAARVLDARTEKVRSRLNSVGQTVLQVKSSKGRGVGAEVEVVLKQVTEALDEAGQLLDELREVVPQAERLGEMADYIEPKVAALEAQIEEFSELAGLGLVAEALSHEIHHIADGLATRTRALMRKVKNRSVSKVEFSEYSEHVLAAVTALRKQLSHLAPSLRYVRETQDFVNVGSFLEDLSDFYGERFSKAGISLVLGAPLDGQFVVKMNRGRLTQVLDNVLLNAEYWLKAAKRGRKISDPAITITAAAPYIRVFDNGIGVDPSVEKTLFQPFVSTKPPGEGRGLGLFIVQQLLDSIGGYVSLLPDRNRRGNRYIFQIDLSGAVQV